MKVDAKGRLLALLLGSSNRTVRSRTAIRVEQLLRGAQPHGEKIGRRALVTANHQGPNGPGGADRAASEDYVKQSPSVEVEMRPETGTK